MVIFFRRCDPRVEWNLMRFLSNFSKRPSFAIHSVEDEVIEIWNALCENGKSGKKVFSAPVFLKQEIQRYIDAYRGELRILARITRHQTSFCFRDKVYFGTVQVLYKMSRFDFPNATWVKDHLRTENSVGNHMSMELQNASFLVPGRDGLVISTAEPLALGSLTERGLREEHKDDVYDYNISRCWREEELRRT